MAFLGRILQVDERETYYKTAIGVETGYNTDVYTIRILLGMLEVKPSVGDQVIFTGHRKISHGKSEFSLDSIKYQEFTSCIECGFPLTSFTCLIKHDKEAQKFDGRWIIFHKLERNGNIKMFFLKENFMFGAVAQPKEYVTLYWLYSKFMNLQEGDRVNLRGWRYKHKTAISFIEKLEE